MIIKDIGKIGGDQDGAAYEKTLFRLTAEGEGTVWDTDTLKQIGTVKIETPDVLKPHCNTVVFGPDKFDENDEFPLLYCNVYNNYQKCENRREGVCGVYRILKDGDEYILRLVQVLKIGFVEDLTLWKSLPENGDRRPYGNFVIDCDKRQLAVFTMRDANTEECPRKTRYFFFNLPAAGDGELDPEYGVPVVLLNTTDILKSFDGNYTQFMQGATLADGKIYSCEGFSHNVEKAPRIRVIDCETGAEIQNAALFEWGLYVEPEMITFFGDKVMYSDNAGNLYQLIF